MEPDVVTHTCIIPAAREVEVGLPLSEILSQSKIVTERAEDMAR